MTFDLQQGRARAAKAKEGLSQIIKGSNIQTMFVEAPSKPRSYAFHMKIAEADMDDARALAGRLDVSVACLLRMILKAAVKGHLIAAGDDSHE